MKTSAAAAAISDLESPPVRHLHGVPNPPPSRAPGKAHDDLGELAAAMAAAADVDEAYRRREALRQRRSLLNAAPQARRVTLYLAREHAAGLARLARDSNRDRNDLIAEALRLYLEDAE